MKRTLLGLGILLLLLPATVVFAQKKSEPTTRNVRGVVTDAGDVPVTGAVVQLENMKTQQIRSYITKEDGSYSFFELNTDTDYKLRAELKSAGTSSGTKTLSSFDSRKQVVINLKLDKK
jgi:hypothetical protein